MPAYENMMVTLTLLLFFTNAMFLFFGTLPADPTNTTRIQLGLSDAQLEDLNSRLNDVIDANVFKKGEQDLNTAITATATPRSYLTLMQNWLFGAMNIATLGLFGKLVSGISLLGTLIGIFGSMFFGYIVWIDLFLPPVGGTGVLGTALKIFLFLIQTLGIYELIFRIFQVGTGVRG